MKAKTRIAVLGTLGDLHRESVTYNVRELSRLVEELEPDLLLAEIPRDHWENGEFDQLPLEYREGLIPLAQVTDMVVVPVGAPPAEVLVVPQNGRLLELRYSLVDLHNRLLAWLQLALAQHINSPVFGFACRIICGVIAFLCGKKARRAWAAQNALVINNVLAAVAWDPAQTVVVTVDCRRRHLLIAQLHRMRGIKVVGYRSLRREKAKTRVSSLAAGLPGGRT